MNILLLAFLHAEGTRIKEQADRVGGMLAAFNAPGVAELPDDMAEPIRQFARGWVREHLARPETVVFHNERTRLHPDQVIILIGRAESRNVNDRPVNNWYVVEANPAHGTLAGAMLEGTPYIDEQPPSLPVIDESRIGYANPSSKMAEPTPARISLLTWTLLMVVVMLVVLIFVASRK